MSTSAANTPGSIPSGPGRAWAVPGYTEVRRLGGGGFGEVVLATHDASGTAVAIKYLHPDLLRDPGHVAAFRAEARTLAGLDSPHVVRLYEYAENPAGAAIVMELVEGVTLAVLLEREGKTSPEAALVVLYGSLLGLAAAHARGVVHRDYKPTNVLVDGQGTSKLTDFGIAALAGDRPLSAGTLLYMPPEQFEGAKASPAADVYAATVTFYQCLAGRVPFDGRTAEELYGKHKTAPVPMTEIPEPLRPVITRGMAKDPKTRPSDAAALAAELREAATSSYGADWEDRGRSHLAEAALLLLALLWPSGGTSATAGSEVEHVRLPHPARGTGQPQPAHPNQPVQTGQPTGTSGQSSETRAEHLHHTEHLEHEAHLEHLEHVEHEEHLAHLLSEDGGSGGKQPNGPRLLRRARAHPVAAAVIAVAAVVVIGVVAAVAATGHSSSGPGAGAAVGVPGSTPSFTASFTMTKDISLCNPSGECSTGPFPLTVVCHSDGSCTATSSHWGSSHQLTFNGTSMSFTGTDLGVVGTFCTGTTVAPAPRVATITLTLTVGSWSGSGAARKPEDLSGPYTVIAPATGQCPEWQQVATLISQ
jgi:serine/threonine protein kinase